MLLLLLLLAVSYLISVIIIKKTAVLERIIIVFTVSIATIYLLYYANSFLNFSSSSLYFELAFLAVILFIIAELRGGFSKDIMFKLKPTKMIIIPLVVLFFVFYHSVFMPPAQVDDVTYHLPEAFQIYKLKTLPSPIPDRPHLYYPMLFETVNAFILESFFGDFIFVKFIPVIYFLVFLAVTYNFSINFLDKKKSVYAVILISMSPLVFLSSMSFLADLPSSIFLVCFITYFFKYLNKKGNLLLPSLFAGISIVSRQTYMILFLFVIIISIFRKKIKPLVIILFALLFYSPAMIRAYSYSGCPLAPFFCESFPDNLYFSLRTSSYGFSLTNPETSIQQRFFDFVSTIFKDSKLSNTWISPENGIGLAILVFSVLFIFSRIKIKNKSLLIFWLIMSTITIFFSGKTPSYQFRFYFFNLPLLAVFGAAVFEDKWFNRLFLIIIMIFPTSLYLVIGPNSFGTYIIKHRFAIPSSDASVLEEELEGYQVYKYMSTINDSYQILLVNPVYSQSEYYSGRSVTWFSEREDYLRIFSANNITFCNFLEQENLSYILFEYVDRYKISFCKEMNLADCNLLNYNNDHGCMELILNDGENYLWGKI